MRDPIQEKDIEQATAAVGVVVDVDDRGIATVRLKRDDLDKILTPDSPSRWGCYSEDDVDDAYRNGYGDGREDALSQIEALAKSGSAA